MPTTSIIRLDLLKAHPDNVRKTGKGEGIEELAQSIAAHGLINPLAIIKDGGDFLVIAGGRRLAAMNLLAKRGEWEPTTDVNCTVYEKDDPNLVAISLSENTQRQAMHPVDEFEAYKKLADQKHGPEEIAARMGTTARHVLQRLRLASVSPKLVALVRKGEMSMDQLEAFTVEPDTRRQEKVWKSLNEWQRKNGHGETIRTALTEQHIPTDDPRVQFVGLDAYLAAGGNVMRDLFDLEDAEAGYVTDIATLDNLINEKGHALLEPIKSEGWKWTAFEASFGWQEEQKMGRVTAALTKEQRTEIAKLEAQQAEHADDGDEQKWDDFETQIGAIRTSAGFTLVQKANAGVVITIGHNGQAEIKRGLVKPEDKRAAAKAEATDKPAKGKPDAKGAEAEKSEPGLSAALRENLTAHRTAALQAKLATNPKVALVALTHALALSVLDREGETVVRIKGNVPHLESSAGDGIAKTPAAKEFAAATREATKGMPRESGKLWAWLMQQDQRRLLSILAVAAAHTVDAVEKKFNGADRAHADQLAEALKLDMATYWQAGAENFFSRVSKEQTIAAVTEAAGAEVAKGMGSMKKAELAVAAEKAVKGRGWVPAILANG